MAKKTALVRDEAYEEMAASYQCLMVSMLNQALKKNGVSKKAARKKICEEFLFEAGNFHDQCWFKAEEKQVYPVLCFSEAFLDTDSDVSKLGTLYAPSEMFAFHEYAFGTVDHCFEEMKEKTSAIETGSVAREEMDELAESSALEPDRKDMKSRLLGDGSKVTCWAGGEFQDGKDIGIWSNSSRGPMHYRLRLGETVFEDWSSLKKQKSDPREAGPDFGVLRKLPAGSYEIDFKIGEELFGASLTVVIKKRP